MFSSIKGINEIENLIIMSNNNLNHPVILTYRYTGELMMLDYSNNPLRNTKSLKIKLNK